MNREVFAGTQCPPPPPYRLSTHSFSWTILFLNILNQLPPLFFFFLLSYIIFMITSYLGENVYIAFTLLVCILFYSTFALHCIARRVWIRND